MKIKKKASNPSRHYINNKSLNEALVKYRADKKKAAGLPIEKQPPIPNYVGECIMMLCQKLGTRPNWSRYTYNEEMVGDAIENCIAAVGNFDPEKTNNPFGYFTQIAWHAFVRRLQREKTQSYIKYKNYETSPLAHYDSHDEDEQSPARGSNENVDVFIANFERTNRGTSKRKGKNKVAKTFT